MNDSINRLLFYDIMWYPVPKNKEQFFLFDDKFDDFFDKKWYWNTEKKQEKHNNISIDDSNVTYSWENKCNLTDDYISFIDKFWWLFRSLPFVQCMYLCNSVTFNHIKGTSDIDLFLICKKDRLWIARFFSVLLFQIAWVRRYFNKISKRFCLSFYVTDDNIDLYSLMLKPYDIYLIYWIAHLVPLYEVEKGLFKRIFEKNNWIQTFLPNISIDQNIFIWNKLFTWSTWFKKFFETIYKWKLWTIKEKLIKFLRLPIMVIKKSILWEKWWGIIISDKMLKFHWQDIRKKINLKFKLNRTFFKNTKQIKRLSK